MERKRLPSWSSEMPCEVFERTRMVVVWGPKLMADEAGKSV